MRASGPHIGLAIPYASETVFFVMRNQYKLAVLIQFSIFVLGLLNLLPPSRLANGLLKRLLLVTAFVRFFNIDPASGALVALSRDDFGRLLHFVLVIGALEMVSFESGMRRLKKRRKRAERAWKQNAIELGKQEIVELL